MVAIVIYNGTAVNGKIVSRSILPAVDRSWIVWIGMTDNGKIDTA